MGDLQPIPRHQNCTEVEKQLKQLRKAGWLARYPGGHWAVVYCPHGCCKKSVAGSPKNCGNEAKRVRLLLSRCPGGA